MQEQLPNILTLVAVGIVILAGSWFKSLKEMRKFIEERPDLVESRVIENEGDEIYLPFLKDIDLYQRSERLWAAKQLWKSWGEPIVVAIVLALLIRAFLIQAYKIPTGSMKPTFMERDRILVDKLSYRFKDPVRGDIIVFKYPENPKKDFVKRLIAVGGETLEIKRGNIFINGKQLQEPESIVQNYYYNRNDWQYGSEGKVIQVPEGHYFVLGDNSANSSDSRNWGFVPEENVRGKAVLIYWPPKRVELVKDK